MFNNRSGLSLFFVLFLLVGYISASPLPTKSASKAVTKPPVGKLPAGKVAAKTPVKTAPKAAAGKATCPSKLRKRGGNVFLGYNGFNGTPRSSVKASGGGELGAVFYIADSVDLAKSFARGTDAKKDYVCLVYADADKWAAQSKMWVGQQTTGHGGNAVNELYVGKVLFASHTAAGLPAGSPAVVSQMGIRQAEIAHLGVRAECHPKSCFDDDHHSLNYGSLKKSWNIAQGL